MKKPFGRRGRIAAQFRFPGAPFCRRWTRPWTGALSGAAGPGLHRCYMNLRAALCVGAGWWGFSGAGLAGRCCADGNFRGRLSADEDFGDGLSANGFSGAGCLRTRTSGDGLSMDRDFHGKFLRTGFPGRVVCGRGLPGRRCLVPAGAWAASPRLACRRFAAIARQSGLPERTMRRHCRGSLPKNGGSTAAHALAGPAVLRNSRRPATARPAASAVRRAPGERWGGICPLPPAPGRSASTGIRARWSCPPAALPQRSGGRTPCRC